MQKLYLALDVYRGLTDVPAISKDVRTKLASMLLHPFPKASPEWLSPDEYTIDLS